MLVMSEDGPVRWPAFKLVPAVPSQLLLVLYEHNDDGTHLHCMSKHKLNSGSADFYMSWTLPRWVALR